MELGNLIQSLVGPQKAPAPASDSTGMYPPLSALGDGGSEGNRQTFLQAVRQYLSENGEAPAGGHADVSTDAAPVGESSPTWEALLASDPELAAMAAMLQGDTSAILSGDIANTIASGGEAGSDDVSLMDGQALLALLNDRQAVAQATSPEGNANANAITEDAMVKDLLSMAAPMGRLTADQTVAQQPAATIPSLSATGDQPVPQQQTVEISPTAAGDPSDAQKLTPAVTPMEDDPDTTATHQNQVKTFASLSTDNDDPAPFGNGKPAEPAMSQPGEEMTRSENLTDNRRANLDIAAQTVDDGIDLQDGPASSVRNLKREAEPSSQPSSAALRMDSSVPDGARADALADTDHEDAGSAKKHHSAPVQAQNSNTPSAASLEKENFLFEGTKPSSPSTDAASQTKSQAANAFNGSLPSTSETDFHKSVMDQIVEKAVIRSVPERSEIHVQLKPEFLGDVRMSIASENGQLSVKIVTDQLTTKEILENQLHHLKAELDKQGLIVDKIEVAVSTNSEQNQSREQFFQMSREQFAGGGRRGYGGDRQQRQPQAQAGNSENQQTAKRNGVNYFA